MEFAVTEEAGKFSTGANYNKVCNECSTKKSGSYESCTLLPPMLAMPSSCFTVVAAPHPFQLPAPATYTYAAPNKHVPCQAASCSHPYQRGCTLHPSVVALLLMLPLTPPNCQPQQASQPASCSHHAAIHMQCLPVVKCSCCHSCLPVSCTYLPFCSLLIHNLFNCQVCKAKQQCKAPHTTNHTLPL